MLGTSKATLDNLLNKGKVFVPVDIIIGLTILIKLKVHCTTMYLQKNKIYLE
jgi:hypothetical protein